MGFALHDEWIKQLEDTTMPTVLLDNFIENNPNVCYIGTDSYEGISMAVNHLYTLGHKNIAFLNGSLYSMVSDQRQEAFENAKNEEKGDASLAEQMKELNEVQVDKAFVSDSINLLGTLSFDKLIGNPLRAAIKAQRDLAKETLSYIREEGMKVDEDGQGQITYVSMTFLKDGKQVRMRVPLLTLMPVPRLSITTMNYTFKAKVDAISSVVASVGSGGSPINSSFAMGGNQQPAAATKPASAGADSQKAAAGKPTETKKTDAPAAAPAVKPTGSEPKVTSAPTMTTS